MEQSKIVLNSGIKNTYGCHERVLTSLACGALSITSDNPFLRQTFEDEKSILFYTHSTLNTLEDKIVPYLQEKEKLRAICEKGRKVVMKFHAWDQRLQELIPEIIAHSSICH